MTHPFEAISRLGVIPVIAINDAKDAIALADALLEGGLPVAEITFRTAAAAEAMNRIRAERPELIVGAGTLLDSASVAAAQESGARFGLAPGYDPSIVDACQAHGLPFAPGVMTPSDVSLALQRDLRIVKFFPAGIAGGPDALRGIHAPFAHRDIRFIPTGGITLETLGNWLSLPMVLAIGGTWIARTEDIRDGHFKDITRKAKAAVEAAQRVRERNA
jgi:2-dehydro-3-deoxyphosphogluconate aldolase/(4S)-4-hydroxy-2-oxoglutarate aldolase